ncbi:MAG: hypothetical protein GY761_04745 [Hyphomicrobiales bacterium]|nr:hypothetical protein [Hyphomicrobiales bacterium]
MTRLHRAGFIFLSAITLASQVLPSSAVAQYKPAQSKTYLINGLVSAIPFIGYGMANLKKRIGGASLYSYVSPIEGTALIQPKIIREIKSLHRRNRDIQINLIGISYGASMVTAISAILSKNNIPINYLGVIDGRPLTTIHSNVRRVDNFTCSFIDCIGVRLRIARGNNSTRQASFRFRTTHINLGNNSDMHNRVIQQISRTTHNQFVQPNTPSIDNMPVAAIR